MEFVFTLRAYGEIEGICPNHTMSELGKVAVTRETLAEIISILAVDHPDPRMIAALPNFEQIAKEALAAIKDSSRASIEAIPKKPGGKKSHANYAWLCFHALRLGAGWPGALELPVRLIYDMIAADQIYSGAANEKPKLTYSEAMSLK